MASVLVIAKTPEAGRVKTRLIGAFSPQQAADLAGCALRDTLAELARHPAPVKVLLLDGASQGWQRPGWTIRAQSAGGLDERLAAGFDAVPTGPAVLVGMDTPQLRVADLDFDLQRWDACLGPAVDGGYWAIGFADPRRARDVIVGVPMSTPHTAAVQLSRMRAAGLRVQLLPTLVDVDTPATAATVARGAPVTQFGHRWRQLVGAR